MPNRRSLDHFLATPVREIMTTCVQLSATQSMDSAAEAFMAHRVTGFPVTDQNGRCVGILSTTDFLLHERSGMPDDPVRLFMTPNVYALTGDRQVRAAIELMCEHAFHRLPVVDEQFRVVGIVQMLDIIASLLQHATTTGEQQADATDAPANEVAAERPAEIPAIVQPIVPEMASNDDVVFSLAGSVLSGPSSPGPVFAPSPVLSTGGFYDLRLD